jgi:hypothetical protein
MKMKTEVLRDFEAFVTKSGSVPEDIRIHYYGRNLLRSEVHWMVCEAGFTGI